jgi:release factor glutamine methyltransferase
LPSARAARYAAGMIERRAAGEPLQYVLGRWGFRRLDLMVDRRVLIPRPETEVVVDAALEELARLDVPSPLVADLGTGCGAIALAIASEHATADVYATDSSPDALAVARANLAGLGTAGRRVRLCQGSWFDALPGDLAGAVAVVVSNPPYVADDEELPPELDWEPEGALRAGPTGLEALTQVIAGAPRWLTGDGALVLELAPHQADAARAFAQSGGFAHIEVRADLAGRDRVLVARR